MRIKKIRIDEQDINLANMVLIVGANGTGKTRLLNEINSAFTGRNRETTFWNLDLEHEIQKDDGRIWHKSLQQFIEREKVHWYSPSTKLSDSHDGRKLTQLEYDNLNEVEGFNNFFENSEFLRKEFTHYLPIESRLNVPGATQRTAQSQATSDSLNLLFRNPKMLNSIQVLIRRLFNRELYLAPHIDPQLELKLAESSDQKMPTWHPFDPQKSYAQYTKWLEKNNVGNIGIEGHGIKAFLHIMLSYSLPTNSILMIDEPELHLYPSLKRKFGQLLGNLTQKNKKQIICVTHDNDFLQGVFDAKCDLVILKLSKKAKQHTVISTRYKSKTSLHAKYSEIPFLQIAFLDCGIIVEGSTDRLVYEYIFSDQKLLNDVEIKFIAAGGKDSVSNPEKIAQDLHVPYAIILDLDSLRGDGFKNFEKILKLNGKSLIIKKIRDLGLKLKGIADLNNKGLTAIKDSDLIEETEAIMVELEKTGIYIVPSGDLESWQEIKCSKAEFPDKFIKKYMRNKVKLQNLIDFLRKIEAYLQTEMS